MDVSIIVAPCISLWDDCAGHVLSAVGIGGLQLKFDDYMILIIMESNKLGAIIIVSKHSNYSMEVVDVGKSHHTISNFFAIINKILSSIWSCYIHHSHFLMISVPKQHDVNAKAT